MIKKQKQENYKTMKVWKETHKRIKELALKEDKPMTQLLDDKFNKK